MQHVAKADDENGLHYAYQRKLREIAQIHDSSDSFERPQTLRSAAQNIAELTRDHEIGKLI